MGLERRREIVAVSHKDGGVYPFVALGTTPRLGGECTARLSCFRTVILLGRWWPAKPMELRSQREGWRTEEASEGDLLKLPAPRSVFPPRRTPSCPRPARVRRRIHAKSTLARHVACQQLSLAHAARASINVDGLRGGLLESEDLGSILAVPPPPPPATPPPLLALPALLRYTTKYRTPNVSVLAFPHEDVHAGARKGQLASRTHHS